LESFIYLNIHSIQAIPMLASTKKLPMDKAKPVEKKKENKHGLADSEL
jgi:hypothetical protein